MSDNEGPALFIWPSVYQDSIATSAEEPLWLRFRDGYGYVPFELGEVIEMPGRKLEVLRKLGWGEYSSVWLSIGAVSYPMKYVTLKVLTANASYMLGRGFLAELEALRKIMSADPGHPGFQHCSHLHDHFLYQSERGYHVCLVIDVQGPSLTVLAFHQPNRSSSLP
ncbi:hypothetical protein OBBRIDRAFT_737223 [Obba rivulosa]|uniref:non-specific serine/threonine protein kinase n=1 Tax=Obba rivulosa TaxID=1052685 RepID=A0A8E2DGA0_9APHY|nr:hypothetical protein OBBRIDRAFT_737223 [Obba rivulosa]